MSVQLATSNQMEVSERLFWDDNTPIGCYTPDAKVLTDEGWRYISDVEEHDMIYVMDKKRRKLCLEPIRHKFKGWYMGRLIHLHNKMIDDFVTPNTRYLTYSNVTGKFYEYVTAQQIQNRSVKNLREHYIPKTAEWRGRGFDYYIIDRVTDKDLWIPDARKFDMWKESYKRVDMIDFMRFLGLFLAEGFCDPNSYEVKIYHRTVRNELSKIYNVIAALGYKPQVTHFRTGNSKIAIFDGRLWVKMWYCAHSPQKRYVPVFAKCQSRECLEAFYSHYLFGKGRIRGDLRNYTLDQVTDEVRCVSRKMIDDLNEIQFKLGFSGTMRDEPNKRYGLTYYSLRSVSEGIRLHPDHIHADDFHYKGFVYGLRTDAGMFYVMQNGKTHWAGTDPIGDDYFDLRNVYTKRKPFNFYAAYYRRKKQQQQHTDRP